MGSGEWRDDQAVFAAVTEDNLNKLELLVSSGHDVVNMRDQEVSAFPILDSFH